MTIGKWLKGCICSQSLPKIIMIAISNLIWEQSLCNNLFIFFMYATAYQYHSDLKDSLCAINNCSLQEQVVIICQHVCLCVRQISSCCVRPFAIYTRDTNTLYFYLSLAIGYDAKENWYCRLICINARKIFFRAALI